MVAQIKFENRVCASRGTDLYETEYQLIRERYPLHFTVVVNMTLHSYVMDETKGFITQC